MFLRVNYLYTNKGHSHFKCLSAPGPMNNRKRNPSGDHLNHHDLETIRQENMTRKTSQMMERRPGQILEGHDLAEDSARQGNLETAC